MKLVSVAGRMGSEYSLTLYMMEGYDRLGPYRLEAAINKTMKHMNVFRENNDMLLVVDGDVDNPHFCWPVFGHITFKDNVK
jgi:hypothetical protein